MDQSMRKAKPTPPHPHPHGLPGNLGELNPLMNYNTPLTIITWAGPHPGANDTLRIDRPFLGCVSYEYRSRYPSGRNGRRAVPGWHRGVRVTTVTRHKCERRIGPANRWTHSVVQAQWPRVGDISGGQQRAQGSDGLASLPRLLGEPWQHWQSQIPKCASQNTKSDAL